MNTSRYVNIDKFVNIQYIFLLARRAYIVENERKEGRKTVYSRHKTASTNDGLLEISKMKYRIPEPGTTFRFCRYVY
jgi:hypothetical protein